MSSSNRASIPSTGTSSVATLLWPWMRISSSAENQVSPPARRATLPSWPNGESTNAVGLRRVRVGTLLAETEDGLADRIGGRPRLALLQPAEPLGSIRTSIDLRIGGREILSPLGRGDECRRPLQLNVERQRLAEGMVDQSVAEEGPVIPRLATERGAVGRSGRDDDGAWALQRGHELPGKARLEDDQTVPDPKRAQHARQPGWGNDSTASLQILVNETGVGLTVAGAVKDQNVLTGVHQLGDTGER